MFIPLWGSRAVTEKRNKVEPKTMNTKRRYIYLKICTLLMFVWLTACNRDPHEGERGMAVTIDNTQCPDVPIGAIKLYIYGTGGNLYATYNYADARGIAAVLHPLEAGHYTVAVVINADEEAAETSTLTALHEWLEMEMSHETNLLSGIAEVNVTEDGISPVTVFLQRGVFTLSTLRLQLTLPVQKLPDYTSEESKTRAAGTANIIRCVAELCKAGTDIVVLHKAVTPVPQADGTYLVELELAEGSYDLRLWTDYARADNPLADTFYHTESLKAVTIVTKPYTANTDAKDAAYYNKSDITLSEEGATMNVQLQRPLAKYRLIAKDVETYRKLMEAKPDIYPPLKNLTVKVQYEGYFPSGFNVSTGKPNDAVGGISYSQVSLHYNDVDNEVLLGGDWVLVNGTESLVNVTVTVTDNLGNTLCRASGVQINYRNNHLTTVYGNFLTAGINKGGIDINTEWSGIYNVWF